MSQRVFGGLRKFIGYVPDRIEDFFRWIDTGFGGPRDSFHGRSFLAFLLPIPAYLFILWGPTLAINSKGEVIWRGGIAALLLLAGLIILQVIYFNQNRVRCRMAWLHLGSVTALFSATWIIGRGAVQASDHFYRHYYALLALIMVLVCVPIASWLRRCQPFTLSKETIEDFKNAYQAQAMVTQCEPKSFNMWDVINAFMLVVLRKPFHVVTPVAAVVLMAPSEYLGCLGVSTLLFLSLILFTISSYDPERDAFVRLVNHTLLSGGTLLITLTVVILALLRLVGVDYVTTVLDAGSKWTIFLYIFSLYCLFWLYDFWIDQAILDLFLDFGEFRKSSDTIQRHGSGRIAVISSDGSGKKRMFEAAAFLMRIAQTAPENRAKLEGEAKRAEQRFRSFAAVHLLVLAAIILVIGLLSYKLNQEPGLRAKKSEVPTYDLASHLLSLEKAPVIMLAASGGGTRAALYTTAVLHGLMGYEKAIDRLVLASGVSGGSAAIAYFAMHKPALLDRGNGEINEKAWEKMRHALSSPFINDVLSGAAEWRIVSGGRLGLLLTESFHNRFHAESRITLGEINDMGLIFNTALCGSITEDTLRTHQTAKSAGGRLLITNLSSNFDRKRNDSWKYDLPCENINYPNASLFAAASLSANFPPIFSNAEVKVGNDTFWVTDGGAVDNRGVKSLLFALIEALEKIQSEPRYFNRKQQLADISLIVADASAFHGNYKSDRGMAAKFGAAEQIANRLIKELLLRAGQLHKAISGRDHGIRVIDLTMPDSMRASGTFGTHWMMPSTVTIRNILSPEKTGIELNGNDLIELIDALFSKSYSPTYIKEKWPNVAAGVLWEWTKEPGQRLAEGLGMKE